MPTRSANATWKGNLKEGKGVVSSESGLINNANYNFAQRFENEKGTNPEELVGAAHSACFSMALSHGLASAGHAPTSVHTVDKVHFDKVESGFAITKIEIHTEGVVPGIDEATFIKFAEDAKKGCPVGKALTGVEFVLHATLKK